MLYDIINKVKDCEMVYIVQIQEVVKKVVVRDNLFSGFDDDEDDEEEGEGLIKLVMDVSVEKQIQVVQQVFVMQIKMLLKIILFVWIVLIWVMRWIQGKGKVNMEMGGMRQVFQDVRQCGWFISDVYVVVVYMEWIIYKEFVGGKIFDCGVKLFLEDEDFVLEYIKYFYFLNDFISMVFIFFSFLFMVNYFIDVCVFFECVVFCLIFKLENVYKVKQFYVYFYKYEF